MDLRAAEMQGCVQPTKLTRKITLNGETKAYPVYRVKLGCLFYNDRNDRIATWLSQYRSEHGEDVFRRMNQEEYNSVIEGFIIESNPASIEKTKLNISLVNQREPGVVLADGRIIDGNRRFTCLRLLSREDVQFDWFETVILDAKIRKDRKQIKMLELAIQHGEEKKVDYNPVDRLVGVYQDIIKTKLLTVEEYAESTNETVREVEKRIEHAELLMEFLEYIHLPEQYHVARDYPIVSILNDLCALLKKCRNDNERDALKKVVFNNIMLKTTGDSRKYIRSLGAMMESGIFSTYIKKQLHLGEELHTGLETADPKNQKQLQDFVQQNQDTADELRSMFDTSLLKAKKRETKAKPSQIVTKVITMLKDVDTKIFDILSDDERTALTDKLSQLTERVNTITNAAVSDEEGMTEMASKPIAAKAVHKVSFVQAVRHIEEPMLTCPDMNKTITNLMFSLKFRLDTALPFQKKEAKYIVFFANSNEKPISEQQEIYGVSGESTICSFTLHSEASEQKECYLYIRSALDSEHEIQQKIPFSINMAFTADFGF